MNFDYDPHNPIERIILSANPAWVNVSTQTPNGWVFARVSQVEDLPYEVKTILRIRYRLGEKHPRVHMRKGKIIG